jgi:fibronectin-binding autotransporter adhesin
MKILKCGIRNAATLLAALLALCSAGKLQAQQTDQWNNTGGSNWLQPTNWSNGVPGTVDTAEFAADPTKAITMTIAMTATNNNGADNQAVGAIEVVVPQKYALGLNAATASGTLTLNGATIDEANEILQNSATSSSSLLTISNSGSVLLTVALGDSINNIIQIDGKGGITISSAIVDGAGGAKQLTVEGAGSGVVTLSGTNSFSGGLNILGPEVDVTSDANLGGAGGSVTINGGQLDTPSGSTVNFTISSARNIYLGSSADKIFIRGTSVVTYNGVIQDIAGSSGGNLVKQGGGTLILGGVSTYSGGTSINNGIVQLTTANALPVGGGVNIGQSASTNLGALDLNGNNQGISGLTSTAGTNTSGTTNQVTTSSGAAVLTINTAAGTTYSYGDGSTTNSGVIAGAISILKTGSGTQILGDNRNTYTGTTTVSAGTLQANTGALGSTATITVNGGGTLLFGASTPVNTTTAAMNLGGGTVNTGGFGQGSTTGGVPTPGLGALTLSAGSTIDFGPGSSSSVLAFADSSGQTWSGTLTIDDWNGTSGTNATTGGGGAEALFFGSSSTGLTAGQLAEIQFVNPDGTAGTYGAGINANGEVFADIPAAVPEPATVFSALLLTGLVACRERKRMRLTLRRRL